MTTTQAIATALTAAGIEHTVEDDGIIALGCDVYPGPNGVEVWEMDEDADSDRVAAALTDLA